MTAAKKAAKREAKRLAKVQSGDKIAVQQTRTIWTKRVKNNPGQAFNPNGKRFAQ